MAESKQVFTTKDGKEIIYDPNSGTVKVHQPHVDTGAPGPGVSLGIPIEILAMLKHLMPPGVKVVDFQMVEAPSFMADPPTQTKEPEDILGTLDYYILVPKENTKYLIGGHVSITSWVTEHKNGHHPEYQGFRKYRILPEQFEWLKKHEDCQVVAYYSPECPVFVSVACQDHAKVMRPVMPQTEGSDGSKGLEFSQTVSVTSQQEAISTEEREI